MNIRNAVDNDASIIAKIQIQAWCLAYKGCMPDDYLNSLSVDLKTSHWHTILSEKNQGVNLVIEYRGGVVGFCVYGPARDDDLSELNVAELVAINILPEYWRMGLGFKLVDHVVNVCRQKSWDSLYLWVVKENSRAIGFYESMNFKFDGVEKVDNKLTGDNLCEIRYVKILSV